MLCRQNEGSFDGNMFPCVSIRINRTGIMITKFVPVFHTDGEGVIDILNNLRFILI